MTRTFIRVENKRSSGIHGSERSGGNGMREKEFGRKEGLWGEGGGVRGCTWRRNVNFILEDNASCRCTIQLFSNGLSSRWPPSSTIVVSSFRPALSFHAPPRGFNPPPPPLRAPTLYRISQTPCTLNLIIHSNFRSLCFSARSSFVDRACSSSSFFKLDDGSNFDNDE